MTLPRSTRPARRPRAFHGAADGEGGFTLLEVVISVTLFVIAATAAGVAILGNTQSSHLSQERVRAAGLAQAELAKIRPGKTLPQAFASASSDGYRIAVSVDPNTPTCPAGTTRAVSVLVFAPNASADAGPMARTDSLVSC